ncbi:putative amidoligase, partial [Amylocarpus encephaloides]
WTVKDDYSISTPYNRDYVYIPVEITSPPFPFTQSSLNELRQVVSALTSTVRVFTNSTYGFHVHVGDGYDTFPFTTVQQLMAILWSFEPQIQSLHPWTRWNSTYCSSLRYPINTWTGATDRGTNSVGDTYVSKYLDPIYKLVHLDHLKGVFSRRNAYNFRQHEATLDVDCIINWVIVCVRLLETARA